VRSQYDGLASELLCSAISPPAVNPAVDDPARGGVDRDSGMGCCGVLLGVLPSWQAARLSFEAMGSPGSCSSFGDAVYCCSLPLRFCAF